MVRRLAAPFVAMPPAGTSTEARLAVTDAEDALLWNVYRFGGSVRAADLMLLVQLRALEASDKPDAEAKKALAAARKRNLTPCWSSRMGGAICRRNNAEWDLALRNLEAHRDGLASQIAETAARLDCPVGHADGYGTESAAAMKRRRLECLQRKLDRADSESASRRLRICLGGKDLARKRHNLDAAGLTEAEWRLRWEAQRGWFACNGTKGETWGNQTFHVNPHTKIAELLLPEHLRHLSNTPGRRPSYRLESPVEFAHLAEQLQERAHGQAAITYELSHRFPVRNKAGGWYLKASWSLPEPVLAPLGDLQRNRTLGVDVNSDHLACYVLDPRGNPVGGPIRIEVLKDTLESQWTTGQKDANVRDAVQRLLAVAHAMGCKSITIENLNFSRFRKRGRDSRKFGRKCRRTVMGMPTAAFRDRLVAMAHNAEAPVCDAPMFVNS